MNMILRGMRLDTEEMKEAVRKKEVHASVKRKYPLVLLDEAVRVAKEVGPTEAARQTGVNIESINKHARRDRIGKGIPREYGKGRPPIYPTEVKQKVVRDALRYKQNSQSTWAECFARAAVNNSLLPKAGASIQTQYRQGTLTI